MKRGFKIFGLVALVGLVCLTAHATTFMGMDFGSSFNECIENQTIEKGGVSMKGDYGENVYMVEASKTNKTLDDIKADIGMIYTFTPSDQLMSVTFAFTGKNNYIKMYKYIINKAGKSDFVLPKHNKDKDIYTVWYFEKIMIILHTSNEGKENSFSIVHIGLYSGLKDGIPVSPNDDDLML